MRASQDLRSSEHFARTVRQTTQRQLGFGLPKVDVLVLVLDLSTGKHADLFVSFRFVWPFSYVSHHSLYSRGNVVAADVLRNFDNFSSPLSLVSSIQVALPSLSVVHAINCRSLLRGHHLGLDKWSVQLFSLQFSSPNVLSEDNSVVVVFAAN